MSPPKLVGSTSPPDPNTVSLLTIAGFVLMQDNTRSSPSLIVTSGNNGGVSSTVWEEGVSNLIHSCHPPVCSLNVHAGIQG